MSVWFEGRGQIDCSIGDVAHSLDNPGEFFVGIVKLLPGMTTVELVDQLLDSVTIRTNEGVMKRTNISKRIEAEHVAVEFDERYDAGGKVSAKSHFFHDFATSDSGVTHRLTMSDVEAPGLLGFFYQRFGSSKMGNAFLTAYKAYFEKPDA